MKISKYENSVLPYSVHSAANICAWRPKDANVTLMYFLHLLPEEFFFSKLQDKL